MPRKIFVNYRRDDARDMAARIRDRLAATFGDANVFMDVDNLIAGQRFDKELEKALAETNVFLAVIGPRWLDLLTERQRSAERDYMREEIAGALQRGIVVIPVLIERMALPQADALPEDIRELVLHQKHIITHEQFGRDVAGLLDAIRFARREARAEGGGGSAVGRWMGAVVLGVLLLGLMYQGREAQQEQRRPVETAAKATSDAVARPSLEQSGPLPDLVMGKEDAPVTIVEYASMTCPRCANFHNNVLPALKEKYIDKGLVRLVFREFPFDERGALAAMVARCAGDDRSLPLISVLFAKQDDWAQAKNDFLQKLFAYAQQAGFSRQSFDRCRQDEALLKNLVAMRDRGVAFGVNSTPTFFVNGKKIAAESFEDFDKTIAPWITR